MKQTITLSFWVWKFDYSTFGPCVLWDFWFHAQYPLSIKRLVTGQQKIKTATIIALYVTKYNVASWNMLFKPKLRQSLSLAMIFRRYTSGWRKHCMHVPQKKYACAQKSPHPKAAKYEIQKSSTCRTTLFHSFCIF